MAISLEALAAKAAKRKPTMCEYEGGTFGFVPIEITSFETFMAKLTGAGIEFDESQGETRLKPKNQLQDQYERMLDLTKTLAKESLTCWQDINVAWYERVANLEPTGLPGNEEILYSPGDGMLRFVDTVARGNMDFCRFVIDSVTKATLANFRQFSQKKTTLETSSQTLPAAQA